MQLASDTEEARPSKWKEFAMDFENMDISPELREKAKACTTPEELLALAKKEGYKLSEEEMQAVSGGGWSEIRDDDDGPSCEFYRY